MTSFPRQHAERHDALAVVAWANLTLSPDVMHKIGLFAES
jgi:hypothetical protein